MDDTDRRADSKGRRGLRKELALAFFTVSQGATSGPAALGKSVQYRYRVFDVHLVGLGVGTGRHCDCRVCARRRCWVRELKVKTLQEVEVSQIRDRARGEICGLGKCGKCVVKRAAAATSDEGILNSILEQPPSEIIHA